SKIIRIITDAQRVADHNSIAELKKRSISKAQPPVLNPASNQPISLSFPHETPVKDIYKALGSAYGINILFDQAVKNDPIAIELKDVTAQQALERLMQAANHFYKALDEHTIIVVPDNPQARRDYEDLVIRTFYLSNGDAEHRHGALGAAGEHQQRAEADERRLDLHDAERLLRLPQVGGRVADAGESGAAHLRGGEGHAAHRPARARAGVDVQLHRRRHG